MSDEVNSPKAAKKSGRVEKPGWRSKGSETPAASDDPNWRAPEGRFEETGEKHPLYRQRLWILGILLAGLGFLGAFLFHLLSIQVQTPLIAIASGPYMAPFAPNSWALEDLEGFFSLHEKNLAVMDLSSAWQAKESGLRELQLELDRAHKHGRRAGAVMIYLSMHGVTDADGNPCLVPPNASPYQSETWLPVSRLLDEIAARHLLEDMRIVLVLDCGRTPVNWQIGLLYNGFTEGLETLIQERVTNDGPLKNLVVLNSTSAGETGFASQDLRASVFGHYFQRGLSGEADDKAQGGNGDRKVSLYELRDYLQNHVDRWARFHRGDRQRPLLLPARSEDFPLAWALSPKRRRNPGNPEALSPPAVPEARLSQLWQDYARLADRQMYHRDPIAWHEFERQLLWLESANQSGKHYERAARQLETLLERKVEQWDRQFEQMTADWPIGGDGAADLARTLSPLHSVPLSKALGKIAAPLTAEVSTAFQRFQEAPNLTEMNRLLEKLNSLPEMPPLVESQLLRAITAYGLFDAGSQPASLPLAVRLRNQSEQLVAPPSVGNHYWTRPFLEKGDSARRQGEDLLLVGDEPSSSQAAVFLKAAQEQYGMAEDMTAIVEQALHVRNQAAAELPWLAQWTGAPVPVGSAVAASDDETIEALLMLIEDFHRLSRMLDQVEIREPGHVAEDPLNEASLKKQSLLVEEGLSRLQARFDKRYDELLFAKAKDAETLRAIESLLAVPLLPREQDELGRNASQQREALAQKRREIASGRHEEFFSNGSEDLALAKMPESSQDSEATVTTELDRLVARWKRHPALALLIDAPPDPGELERAGKDSPRKTIAQREAKVRRHLLSLPELTAATRNAPAETVTDYRKHLCEAARLTRIAAGFGFPAMEQNPIAQLERFDLQQLFLWNAYRHLDDFWGLAVDDSTRFYELAAGNCLKNAGLVFEANPLWNRQLREAGRLLEERKLASQTGLVTRATNAVRIHPDEEISTNVAVMPGTESAARSLPPGFATVFIQKFGGPLPTARHAVKVPVIAGAEDAQAFPFVISGDAVQFDSEVLNLRAITLFRGHSFAEPFQLLAMGGTQVSIVPQSFDTAQIIVKSFLNRRSSIVFILDSSATMYDPILRENTGGTVRKLDAARSALNRMLEEIAQLPRTHVGVFFYGHRVAARPDVMGVLERQQAYKAKYPFDDSIQPYEDVEKVLELGRFSSVFAGQIAERLELLKPWGETPLYLAITRAIAEFENDDPDAEKNIVVVTDGLNYQFNPSQEANKTVSDVLAAARGKNIRIHIVGLGITEQDAQTAQREFGQIARSTEGKYVAVDRASRLIDSIKTVLEPREYVVTSATGERQAAKVRQPIIVATDATQTREFRVELGELQTAVTLEGGESAELVVSTGDDKLECVRYEDNSPRFVPLIVGTPARVSGFEVGIHQPKFLPGGVRFEVSLQDVNRSVPPRPKEIWVEVVPKEGRPDGSLPGTGKSYPRYVFYDAEFTPDRPVPVVTFVAEGWPLEARFAEIRFWCNFRATEPMEIVAWENIASGPFHKRVDMPFALVPGITWQLNPRGNRVAIVERHSANSPGINALKVDLLTKARPIRITRRFDEKSGLVSHLYEYDPSDIEHFGTSDKPQIQFRTRKQIHAEAHRMDDPLLLEIGEASDVILPNALLMAP